MPPLDEGTLRERFPEIPWAQPVLVTVALSMDDLSGAGTIERYCCRYCITLDGLSALQLIRGNVPFAFVEREHCLDHIEERHHD
jgi:hypothetical protein